MTKTRVFFKVLSSWSFFKGKRLKWYSYLEIQYGGQNVIAFLLSYHRSKISKRQSPSAHFETNLGSEVFLCFQKRQAVQSYIFIEPKFRPDKHHLCTGSRSNESSRQNLVEKLVYFSSCRLLSTTPKNQMVLKIIFDWTHTGKVAEN